MTTIKVAVAEELSKPFALREVVLDEPGPNEVRVRLVATGVCHTDAAIRDGIIPAQFPIVLGHEGAGVVEEVGAGVSHLETGDHVVLSYSTCGTCEYCVSGSPARCLNIFPLSFMGNRPDGSSAYAVQEGAVPRSHFFGQSSFAERANVAVRSVVKVPNHLPLEILGPLGCGIQTGAGSVLNVLKPQPHQSFVVFGTGAVGLSAVLAAVSERVGTIIAVDLVPQRLQFARELGATHTIDASTEDVVARIHEITGGGAKTALDTTGHPRVFGQMIDSLGAAGHAGVLGSSASGASGIIDLPSALARGLQISWILEGNVIPQTFVPHLLALYEAGDFPFDKLIKTYPFEQINEAFADSHSGHTIKPVVVF